MNLLYQRVTTLPYSVSKNQCIHSVNSYQISYICERDVRVLIFTVDSRYTSQSSYFFHSVHRHKDMPRNVLQNYPRRKYLFKNNGMLIRKKSFNSGKEKRANFPLIKPLELNG